MRRRQRREELCAWGWDLQCGSRRRASLGPWGPHSAHPRCGGPFGGVKFLLFSREGASMKRVNLVARLLRALSGKSQERVAEEIGVHPSFIGQIEIGQPVTREHLEGLARSAGVTLGQAWEILEQYEVFFRTPQREGQSVELILDQLAAGVRAHAGTAYRRLLTLPLPTPLPDAGDRQRAAELWGRLAELSEEARLGVVRAAEAFQSWSLCERVCQESAVEASRQVERAAGLARLAQEIAEQVPGPEEWRNRLRGYAGAHVANVLRVSGELNASDAAFAEAKRLW